MFGWYKRRSTQAARMRAASVGKLVPPPRVPVCVRVGLVVAGLSACALIPSGALAQWRTPRGAAEAQPAAAMATSDPITFTADKVEYDKDRSLVTATGAVEAWQNGHVLRADSIIFNRDTGIAAASGHVALLEPDGETLFASYAEMTKDMRSGILKDMGALLSENGRLLANGARRTGGTINELSKVVYSTCDLCADDPAKPPLWQIRAASAVQDTEHQFIEYRDAVMDIYGVPVAYFPYLTHPDPSVPRQSGLLMPLPGNSSSRGAFFAQPYYWVIDKQSDATITPMVTTRVGPHVDIQYRERFNNGTLLLNTSGGYIDKAAQGSGVARGQFNYDDTWRWGFDINRASSIDFLRAFHTGLDLGGSLTLLPSTVYVEGFGQGAYTRLDTIAYQSLSQTIPISRLPIVLPRYQYSYFGQPDGLGGRLSLDLGAFNVMRGDGTDTRRTSLTVNWERPFTGLLGDRWKVTLHGDAAGYDANQLNNQPNFSTVKGRITTARALPQMAVDVRWPFARDAGAWGTQLLEPMAQVVVAPRTGDNQRLRYPNEDSLDFEFSDANLFGFNRFPGIDRLEGGVRVNAALHGAWYLGGTTFDGLVGQSFRDHRDDLFPAASGLRDRASDIVARGTVSPTKWLDLTYRTRFDPKTLATRMIDGVGSLGTDRLRVSAGYTYSTVNPYGYYDQVAPPPVGSSYYTPRHELSIALSTRWDAYRFSGFARRDIATNQMVAWGGDVVYEDECFVLDLRVSRRYTHYLYDNGATEVLFQVLFKTIGQVGYRAL